MAKIVNRGTELKPAHTFSTGLPDYTVEFTGHEMLVLFDILQNVGGNPESTPRRYAETIVGVLLEDSQIKKEWNRLNKSNTWKKSSTKESIYYSPK